MRAAFNARHGQASLGLPVFVWLWGAFGLLLGGCSERTAPAPVAASAAGGGGAKGGGEVIVYCSADSVYAEPVFKAFMGATGIQVRAVYDTEATKTTGLVNRLIAEKERPRADVWWSSEPFGTMRLANAGVLEAYRSEAAEKSVGGGWPADLRDSDGLWYGFAPRARVFVYNTTFVPEDAVPQTLHDLTLERFRGRVGVARPQFGTTRGHMAAILDHFGEAAFRSWLRGLKANDVRLLDGNASVVRAVARGEIHVGLTDTDDVYSGQREGWPVALAFERLTPRAMAGGAGAEPAGRPEGAIARREGMGPMLVPNTVAKVRGGPNGANAGPLIDFLLSARAQRILAESDSRNAPVDPALRKEFERFLPPAGAAPDLERVAGRVEEAMRIVEEELEE